MAVRLPPPPLKQELPFELKEWFNQVYRYIAVPANQIPWNQIDFSSSDLGDLEDRPHSDLTVVAGSPEQFHIASSQYTELIRNPLTTSTAVDLTLNDNHHLVYVTVTGKTITLPVASVSNIGKEWTVVLAVAGNVTITRAGSDTINLPTADTSVVLNNKGSSLTFRCVSATSWSII